MERSKFIKKSGLSLASMMFFSDILKLAPDKMIEKQIPSSGEKIPGIGMGSWLTFDVGSSESRNKQMFEVVNAFFQKGGKLIDSSPMYGSSETAIGSLVAKAEKTDRLWAATKVWTDGRENGVEQINSSVSKLKKFPYLFQVHNLRDYKIHLKTLRDLKSQGKLKYIGVTHYVNSSHEQVMRIINEEPLDFVQIDLSIRNTDSERRLLPLAKDKGLAVIINQPFETGNLFQHIKGRPLPVWAADYQIKSWAAFFLKYIISNPAVTCTIPATTQVAHVLENMAACYGDLPDENIRKKMREYF